MGAARAGDKDAGAGPGPDPRAGPDPRDGGAGPEAPSLALSPRWGSFGPWRAGGLLALIYFVVALGLQPAYGPTWDLTKGEFPHGERLLEFLLTGERGFLNLSSSEPRPVVREPHPDFDVGRFATRQVYTVGSLLSAVSCKLLWTWLGWVPPMEAHDLVISLCVAVLVACTVRFLTPHTGLLAALTGMALLLVCPRWFADSFNNLKDSVMACLYVLSLIAGYLALTRGDTRWLIATGALIGLSLAQKANALFLPVHLGLFAGLAWFLPTSDGRRAVRLTRRGLLLAPLALLVTYYVVRPDYWFTPLSGPWAWLQEQLRQGHSSFGLTEARTSSISLRGPLMVGITTPPLVLLLAPLGLLVRRVPLILRLFLLLGALFPIGRLLLPGMRDYDGVRHYLEFYPPLCALAGIALAQGCAFLARGARGPGGRGLVTIGVPALALFFPLRETVRTHPNGVAYFNAFIGGLPGAQQSGVPESTDYWGNSYWQGLDWLAREAEPHAVVVVPIAEHVVRCAAPLKLRDDLELWHPGVDPGRTVYAMYITRVGSYRTFVRELERSFQPVHEIRVQGAPILRIVRLGPDPRSRAALALWEQEQGALGIAREVLEWMQGHPDQGPQVRAILVGWNTVGAEATLERLSAFLPPELLERVGESLPALGLRLGGER